MAVDVSFSKREDKVIEAKSGVSVRQQRHPRELGVSLRGKRVRRSDTLKHPDTLVL